MVGFPHSEIIGSKLIRSSPTLIAAYYVLHRLCTPRHPLNALKTLDRSHYQCPQHQQRRPLLRANVSVVGIVKSATSLQRFLIGQIKLTRIHVAFLFLPGVRVKRNKKPSLYNVERSANQPLAGSISKLCLFATHRCNHGMRQSSRACPALRRSANRQTRKATSFFQRENGGA